MKTVQIEQAGVSVPALPGDTILKAARNAGIEYPFSCQSGRCGACKYRILVGEVEHLAPLFEIHPDRRGKSRRYSACLPSGTEVRRQSRLASGLDGETDARFI